jgi:hypothetical protein
LLLSRDDTLHTLLPELGTAALDVRAALFAGAVTALPVGGFLATGALTSTAAEALLLRVEAVGLSTEVGVVERGVVAPPPVEAPKDARLPAVGVVGRDTLVGVVDLLSEAVPNDDRTPAVGVVDL